MLNAIWAGMILLAVIFAACTGRMGEVTNAALDSAGEAISLCITMAGVVALWMGLMEIAKRSGIISGITRTLLPVLRFLFPKIPSGHPALEYIAVNVTANILGLGWACTPAGLKAMEALAQLEQERGSQGYAGAGSSVRYASTEMCVFLILNISSLQLIPVNMIAYRSKFGSANPSAIIAPAILATAVSTLTAVVYCKWKERRERT